VAIVSSPAARFACRALTCVLLVQAGVGLTLAFGYESPLFSWHREGMAQALWGTPEVPGAALPLLRQLNAMLGGTIVSFGLAGAWIAHVPLQRGERWAALAIASSAGAWFVIDTTMSALHGVTVNVLFNVMALAMIALPLGVWWRAVGASAR
jgi:hypothetical protein